MILKVNKPKTSIIKSLDEFADKYNCKEWIEANIHLYETYITDQDGLLVELVKDYLKAQNELFGLIALPKGIKITCYYIPFSVVTNRKIYNYVDLEEAKDKYIALAQNLLKGFPGYMNYPKEKLSFDVYQQLIANGNFKLKLIRTKP